MSNIIGVIYFAFLINVVLTKLFRKSFELKTTSLHFSHTILMWVFVYEAFLLILKIWEELFQ